MDFVLPFDRDRIDAIEVKWSGDALEPRGLRAFRDSYPNGRNWLVTAQTLPAHTREVSGLEVSCVGIEGLREALAA